MESVCERESEGVEERERERQWVSEWEKRNPKKIDRERRADRQREIYGRDLSWIKQMDRYWYSYDFILI